MPDFIERLQDSASAVARAMTRRILRSRALRLVSATAGSVSLLFTSSISNPLLAAVPVGMWAKASISPRCELAREAAEAEPVGNADRDSPLEGDGFEPSVPVHEVVISAFPKWTGSR